MKEIWKDIKEYEGLYQVSNLGRIKSLPKYRKAYNGGYITKERMLNGYPNSTGYLRVFLKKNGREKKFFIHRLVAECFIENKDNKPEVNHIDSDFLNNNVNNLEWVNHQENMQHAWKSGRLNHIVDVGKKYGKRTIKYAIEKRYRKVCMLDNNGNVIKEYNTMTEAWKENNLDSGGLTRCCQGKQSTCGGYKWKYEQ